MMNRLVYNKYFFIIILLLINISGLESIESDKKVVLEKLFINGIENNDKESEFVLAKTDSLKIIFSLKSNQGAKTAFIFKITIQNDKDSTTFNANSTTLSYFNLPESDYKLSIGAFDPRNSWTAEPLVIKFRVNNKDAQIRKDLDSVKKANQVLDSINLSKNSLTNGFSNYYIIATFIILIGSIVFLIFYLNKVKKNKDKTLKGNIMEMSEGQDKLMVENANLKAEIAALRAQIDTMQSRGEDLKKQNEDLRESLNKLAKSKKEIEELQVHKDDLFAVIIHDIKNPASLIKQLVDLLRSYDLNAVEQQEVINDIFTTTSKIVKLSQEVTRVLALESTHLKMTYDKVDITDILKDVSKRNSIAAKKKDIDLLLDLNDTLPETFIDINKIDEVCDNLLSNAIKFNIIGGQVKVSAKYSNKQITVEISDKGQGLSEEDVRKAFNRGVKLSAQPTGGENSSGFGLWIVKKLIEAHQGRVWVKSAIGKGSTFAFSIPVVTEEPEDN